MDVAAGHIDLGDLQHGFNHHAAKDAHRLPGLGCNQEVGVAGIALGAGELRRKWLIAARLGGKGSSSNGAPWAPKSCRMASHQWHPGGHHLDRATLPIVDQSISIDLG